MHRKHRCHHKKNVDCFIQFLKLLCDCNDHEHDHDFVEGFITLNQGHHEITVNTEIVPSEVFLSIRPVGIPVCVADIDMVGYTLLPDGFVLYADIKSNVAEICYFVQS